MNYISILKCFIILTLIYTCQSNPKASDSDQNLNTNPEVLASNQAEAFPAWDSLQRMLMPHWGKSAFWNNKSEECAYYESRFNGEEMVQFESISTVRKVNLSPPGSDVPSWVWFYRLSPADSTWPVQEGRFEAGTYLKPTYWSRDYRRVGVEQYGQAASSSAYALRTIRGPEIDGADSSARSESAIMADQLHFLLRSLSFTEGRSVSLPIYPHTRRLQATMPPALTLSIVVEEPQNITFLEEDYSTWLITLRLGQQVIERYWFARSYPNTLIRWESMSGEKRMLKYVRYIDESETQETEQPFFTGPWSSTGQ